MESRKAHEVAEHAEQRAATIRRRFMRCQQSAKDKAGDNDGKAGDISLRLRLPGGSQIDAKFNEGVSVAAIIALVLSSEWAGQNNPWGLNLLCNFPRRCLGEADIITK